jgi:hypothetical protein
MKNMLRAYPIVWLCFLCGCILRGDGLINATTQDIRVVIRSRDRQVIERTLQPHMNVGERRRSLKDSGVKYQSIEVFDKSGQKLGGFSASDMPNAPSYGKYLTLIITGEGIFPVPGRYLDHPEDHVSEIIQFYHEKAKGEK